MTSKLNSEGLSKLERDMAVLECLRDGVQLQFRERHTDNSWEDRCMTAYVGINTCLYDYRIKPEPKTLYVNEYPHGCSVYTNRSMAEDYYQEEEGLRCAVPYQEIIEELGT